MVRGFLIFLPLPLTRMLDSSESLSAFKLATVSHVGSSSGHPESFNGPHYGRARPGDSYHPPNHPPMGSRQLWPRTMSMLQRCGFYANDAPIELLSNRFSGAKWGGMRMLMRPTPTPSIKRRCRCVDLIRFPSSSSSSSAPATTVGHA